MEQIEFEAEITYTIRGKADSMETASVLADMTCPKHAAVSKAGNGYADFGELVTIKVKELTNGTK